MRSHAIVQIKIGSFLLDVKFPEGQRAGICQESMASGNGKPGLFISASGTHLEGPAADKQLLKEKEVF